MKNSNCCSEQPKRRTTCGGQALIEGIMMQGPERIATVVKKRDGSHVVQEQEYVPMSKKHKICGIPFLRGIFVFGGSLKNGVKQIMFSADAAEVEEGEPSKFDKWVERKFGTEKAEKFLMGVALVLGIVLPIGLFILLPTLLASLIPLDGGLWWVRSLAEGVLRLAIFIGYLYLTSLMKDMRRTYGYHGAEHKTIRCYEAKLPLTVENVRPMTRLHPRCGTSFLFVVMIISILVFSAFTSLITIRYRLLKVLFKLLLLPIVVAISYEINRFVGRHDNWFTRAISFPGMWLQNFTTNEPDDSMIEVAIRALELVIPETEGADEW